MMSICKRLAALSLLAAAAAGPAVLQAATTVREIRTSADTTDTKISGFDAKHQTPKQPGEYAILSGLEFDETGDKPCLIISHWWRFSNDDDPQELTTEFNICRKQLVFQVRLSGGYSGNPLHDTPRGKLKVVAKVGNGRVAPAEHRILAQADKGHVLRYAQAALIQEMQRREDPRRFDDEQGCGRSHAKQGIEQRVEPCC